MTSTRIGTRVRFTFSSATREAPIIGGLIKKITAADGTTQLNFGRFAVDIDNNTIAVGAFQDPPISGGIYRGSVYIFRQDAGGGGNWGQVKKILAADGAPTDEFGRAVAISGDKVLVGAPSADVGSAVEQGKAYVFEQNAGGADNWGEVRKLAAADGAASDFFGSAVALDGKTALVGAWRDDIGAGPNQGSAYVFGSQNVTWSEKAQPLPVSCTVDDSFGRSVAVSGDTAVVGAPYADVGPNANQGAAYVFERNLGGSNNWGLVKVLTAPDGAADDRFGWSVSISGDRVVVGAAYDDNGPQTDSGSVAVFERNQGGAENWGLTFQLFAGGAGASFGFSVSLDGDAMVAGAPFREVGGNGLQGEARVIRFNAGTPSFVKTLHASDGTVADQFGWSVGISTDTIIVGAVNDSLDNTPQNRHGSAYVFERNEGGAENWGETKKLTASDFGVGDAFGFSVAISGETVIVGAVRDDVGANQDQGSAYVFDRNDGGTNNWGEVKKLTASDGLAGEEFGNSLAISGDTVVVGKYRDRGVEGAAYIYEKNAGGTGNWGQTKKLTVDNQVLNRWFGYSVAIDGDVIVVGSLFDTVIDGQTVITPGSGYVYDRDQGGAGNWGLADRLVADDGADFNNFGYSVSVRGGTVLIGAPGASIGANTREGAAYVFDRNWGGANNFGQVKKLAAADAEASASFGRSVSLSGGTAIVGSPFDDVIPNENQGSAYIFEQDAGGANNWGQVKKLTASNGTANALFGIAVAVSGDDILIGAHLAQIEQAFGGTKSNMLAPVVQGSAYVFRGSPLAPTAAPVSVSGRVKTALGRGIRGATVRLISQDGRIRSAVTGTFGYYRFDDVPAGEIYVVYVASRRYDFKESSRILTVNDNLTDVDFVATR